MCHEIIGSSLINIQSHLIEILSQSNETYGTLLIAVGVLIGNRHLYQTCAITYLNEHFVLCSSINNIGVSLPKACNRWLYMTTLDLGTFCHNLSSIQDHTVTLEPL